MRASAFAPSIRLACFTTLITLSVTACTHAPAMQQLSTVAVPNDSAVFDAGSCLKGEFVSVRNNEDYSILLRAEPSAPPSANQESIEAQELGWLSAGQSDVLLNLRPQLTHLLALPDSEHGQYKPNAKDGRPTRWPSRVEFSCVASNF